MNDGIELAKSLFQKIVGMKPSRIEFGHGSFITMDFGRDIPIRVKTRKGLSTRCHGEWHLWKYMCAWRIDKDKKPLVGSNDTREKIENALCELKDKNLESVEILNHAFDTKLIFGNDIELFLFSFYTQDDYEQWMLFTPERKTFTAGPGSQWSYEWSSSNENSEVD